MSYENEPTRPEIERNQRHASGQQIHSAPDLYRVGSRACLSGSSPSAEGGDMKLDATNIEIIRHLKDGRKSFKRIANALSITENTVRSRVNKMSEEGLLDISGNIRIDALPGHSLLYLGIKLNTMELQKKAAEFSRLRGVVSAGIVTGRYDLILQVLLNEEYTLLEFITAQVTKVKEVQTVESFLVYEGYNLKVPYIL